ncbi:MAG: hypothetical protein FuTmV1_gp1 [Fushun tombus-like virus 1]|nr:MAG: hypothetical protein FuTmV1_gp1 [Fushun tombus-like virus 1]
MSVFKGATRALAGGEDHVDGLHSSTADAQIVSSINAYDQTGVGTSQCGGSRDDMSCRGQPPVSNCQATACNRAGVSTSQDGGMPSNNHAGVGTSDHVGVKTNKRGGGGSRKRRERRKRQRVAVEGHQQQQQQQQQQRQQQGSHHTQRGRQPKRMAKRCEAAMYYGFCVAHPGREPLLRFAVKDTATGVLVVPDCTRKFKLCRPTPQHLRGFEREFNGMEKCDACLAYKFVCCQRQVLRNVPSKLANRRRLVCRRCNHVFWGAGPGRLWEDSHASDFACECVADPVPRECDGMDLERLERIERARRERELARVVSEAPRVCECERNQAGCTECAIAARCGEVGGLATEQLKEKNMALAMEYRRLRKRDTVSCYILNCLTSHGPDEFCHACYADKTQNDTLPDVLRDMIPATSESSSESSDSGEDYIAPPHVRNVCQYDTCSYGESSEEEYCRVVTRMGMTPRVVNSDGEDVGPRQPRRRAPQSSAEGRPHIRSSLLHGVVSPFGAELARIEGSSPLVNAICQEFRERLCAQLASMAEAERVGQATVTEESEEAMDVDAPPPTYSPPPEYDEVFGLGAAATASVVEGDREQWRRVGHGTMTACLEATYEERCAREVPFTYDVTVSAPPKTKWNSLPWHDIGVAHHGNARRGRRSMMFGNGQYVYGKGAGQKVLVGKVAPAWFVDLQATIRGWLENQGFPKEDRCWEMALVNWYYGGGNIGPHADDEAEIDQELPIISWSCGDPVNFCYRLTKNSRIHIQPILTTSDKVVVMPAGCQRHSQHWTEAPADSPHAPGWRINVTWRGYKKRVPLGPVKECRNLGGAVPKRERKVEDADEEEQALARRAVEEARRKREERERLQSECEETNCNQVSRVPPGRGSLPGGERANGNVRECDERSRLGQDRPSWNNIGIGNYLRSLDKGLCCTREAEAVSSGVSSVSEVRPTQKRGRAREARQDGAEGDYVWRLSDNPATEDESECSEAGGGDAVARGPFHFQAEEMKKGRYNTVPMVHDEDEAVTKPLLPEDWVERLESHMVMSLVGKVINGATLAYLMRIGNEWLNGFDLHSSGLVNDAGTEEVLAKLAAKCHGGRVLKYNEAVRDVVRANRSAVVSANEWLKGSILEVGGIPWWMSLAFIVGTTGLACYTVHYRLNLYERIFEWVFKPTRYIGFYKLTPKPSSFRLTMGVLGAGGWCDRMATMSVRQSRLLAISALVGKEDSLRRLLGAMPIEPPKFDRGFRLISIGTTAVGTIAGCFGLLATWKTEKVTVTPPNASARSRNA